MKMKQISQSQFISISDTLCDIVKGLNESQIAATFESVAARLCSSFDTVVIPPMSAIQKCLDHLVKSLRLDFINGSYHSRKVMPAKQREKLTIGLQAPLETQTAVPNMCARPSIEKDRSRRQSLKGHSYENGKRTATKKLQGTANSDTQRQIEPKYKMKEELSLTKKHSRKGKKNQVVKSSSLKVRKPNHCIPRRQYSYQEFHSHAENQKEHECKKHMKKRNSFLGRLSRFFQIDDEKLTSNDEIDNNLDDEGCCHNGWENIVTDEQVKLIPSKVETRKKYAVRKSREKKNKRKKPKRMKGKHVAGTKVIDKKSHAEKLSVRNKNAQYNKSRTLKFNKLNASQSSESSTDASSRSRSPDWTNKNFTDRDKKSVDHQLKGKFCRRRDKSSEQYSLSSFSDSSCSNLSNSDSSQSSKSSVELDRKSLQYFEEEKTDVESLQACKKDSSTDFCSTQAICGDLELSRLSLNQTKKTTLSSSDTSSTNHVKKHSTVIPGLNKTRTLNHDSQQNTLRGRDLLQLIGVL